MAENKLVLFLGKSLFWSCWLWLLSFWLRNKIWKRLSNSTDHTATIQIITTAWSVELASLATPATPLLPTLLLRIRLLPTLLLRIRLPPTPHTLTMQTTLATLPVTSMPPLMVINLGTLTAATDTTSIEKNFVNDSQLAYSFWNYSFNCCLKWWLCLLTWFQLLFPADKYMSGYTNLILTPLWLPHSSSGNDTDGPEGHWVSSSTRVIMFTTLT